ncbi:MAG TPA: NAD(P)H-hydrate dehydratase [Acidimicrobiales bacterium]|nr:NAD(P)H-hydrate dehydratase [Acidimicrobiales bacterium]
MKPVVTVAEMKAIDADALTRVDHATLVDRAGTAVATAALRLLGGGYGRRVVVVAGKGSNGADGRVAADRLRRRGARVRVLEAAEAPERIGRDGRVDLVIDAAYGTGFRGTYRAPSVPAGVPVLAVDIPSGVDGDTGEACGEPLRADVTVTFAALKPGLLQGDGPLLAGRVEVVDIGLGVDRARLWVVEDADVARLLPVRPRNSYKWQSAVAVVAGSPGMSGAAELCARAAYRAGAGMVRLGVPGADPALLPAGEAVATELAAHGWADTALEMVTRCRALVVGPGLGRAAGTAAEVRRLVAEAPVPVVVDADGLVALGTGKEIAPVVGGADGDQPGGARAVLTPHDGEFAGLTGGPPGVDRIDAARTLAAACGAVVLLKGPTTVVAEPGGTALIVTAGSPRLATAGTGDVLSGAIGAFVARGLPLFEAAGLAAHVHGRAADLGPPEGLVAGDLADLLGRWLSGARRG